MKTRDARGPTPPVSAPGLHAGRWARAARWLCAGALLALAACKSAGGVPGNASTTVLSFADLDCSDCGETMAKSLIQTDGVYKTSFDKRRAELTVVAEPNVDALALAEKQKPADEKWRLVRGAGKGRYLPWHTPPTGADVKQVAMDGEDVPDLSVHLSPGKVTVVDFSAKWCEPCRELDKHVLGLLEKRSDLAYRKLDVGDWDTPLGARYLKGVKALPHVLVFDKAGKQVAAISGLDLAGLDAALAKASPEAGQ
ncbi:MAG: thioredoxin family protein [Polyangiaceae bacterium]